MKNLINKSFAILLMIAATSFFVSHGMAEKTIYSIYRDQPKTKENADKLYSHLKAKYPDAKLMSLDDYMTKYYSSVPELGSGTNINVYDDYMKEHINEYDHYIREYYGFLRQTEYYLKNPAAREEMEAHHAQMQRENEEFEASIAHLEPREKNEARHAEVRRRYNQAVQEAMSPKAAASLDLEEKAPEDGQ